MLESSSFPSGHALGSMVVYAVTAYLIAQLQAERWLRRLTIIIAALLIFLIGLSRVYLGVHYPSDVIGGYTVGFAWATFCVHWAWRQSAISVVTRDPEPHSRLKR